MTATPPPRDPQGPGGSPETPSVDAFAPPAGAETQASPVAPPNMGTPYPGTPYAGAPYGQPTAVGTHPAPPTGADGLSIAALVTGILFLGIVPLVLGIVGLRRVNKTRQGGAGMAIAGIVLGAISTVLWAIVIAAGVLVATDAARESVIEGPVTVLRPSVGQCLLIPARLTSEPPTAVDCATAHDAEVYAELEMTDREYPGEDEAISEAWEFCVAEFPDFVGADYGKSTMEILQWYPTALSWRLGDRHIACAVLPLDGTQLTGTVEGSGR